MSIKLPDLRTVIAHNTAKASENKIHDDAVAKQFGFSGGLVPGVDVYAYMTNPAVRHFGPEWLARGTMGDEVVGLVPMVGHDDHAITQDERHEAEFRSRGETPSNQAGFHVERRVLADPARRRQSARQLAGT